MDKANLLKFIEERRIYTDWYYEKLFAWIEISNLNEFCQLVGKEFLSKNPIKSDLEFNKRLGIHFSNGYCLVIDLVPICENFNIEPRDILNQQI